MSFLERHWWISLVGSLVCAAAMVIAPVVLLQQQLPLDIELRKSFTEDYLLAGAFATIFFVSLLMFAYFAIRGRYRARLRAEALRGNLAVMPISLLLADAQKAPDVSRDPLVLLWRANMRQSAFSAAASLLMAAFWGFVLMLSWVGVIINFSKFIAIVQEQWLPFAGIFVATLVYAALMVIQIRYLPTQFGKPFGLTASDEGVSYRTAFGREGFMRWEEMKLLEVEQYGVGSSATKRREFTLFRRSGQHVIGWKDTPPTPNGEFVPDGISHAEMTVRLQELLHLINARTGLVPRTLSTALHSQEAESTTSRQDMDGRGKSLPQAREGLRAGVGMVIFLLALATVVVVLPMSNLFVLNAAVASSFIIVALILTVWLLQSGFQQRRVSNDRTLPPFAGATAFSDVPGSVYTVSFGLSSRNRLVLALIGLVMLVDIVSVILIVVSSIFHGPLSLLPSHDSTASNLGVVLLIFVGACGVVGSSPLIVAFWPVTVTVRATRSVLSSGRGINSSRAIPWESIEQITAQVRQGNVVHYTITGDVGRTTISWPAEPSTLRDAPPIDGITPITPDQLAALAAQRSGKEIEAVHV